MCKDSLYCPTTEEYILPIIHGNDRVEWFVQLCDEIRWDVADRDTGAPRAKVTMRAGDVAAMPADIRHQGYSTKRSMLLVWENASPELPELIAPARRRSTRSSSEPDLMAEITTPGRQPSARTSTTATRSRSEGFTHLIPHAAGHEIIRQGRRDLHLVRMTPDIVYDQLIGAGCARER